MRLEARMEISNEYGILTPMSLKTRKIYLSYLGVLVFFVVFVLGYVLGSTQNDSSLGLGSRAAANRNEARDFNLFWDVWDILKSDFVRQPVSEDDLYYGSIEGLVASLDDPYSTFLNPKLAQSFQEELTGTFQGIGAELGTKEGFLVIVAPLSGSPAESAGLKPSDRILAIDGKDTVSMSLGEAVSLIRGKQGTAVTLTMSRSSEPPFDVTIKREQITVPSLTFETKENNIEVISISHFSQETAKVFTARVNEMLVNQPRGLILDLRNNPGGYLDIAVDIASHFVEDQPIVYEVFSDGRRETYRSTGRADLKDMKVAVLVNGGSASASEILAGALQDYKLATLIGEKTFGKGSVQQLRNFDDGSALKLTVAEWLTPNERAIDGVGIEPDQAVALSQEDDEQGRDPQMDAAIQWINL